MNNITLIHPFEVSKDKEDKFLSIWKNVDNYMKKQPGFIETKLHKSIENALTHKNTIYNFEQDMNNLKIDSARVNAELENLETEMLGFPNVEIIINTFTT